jgi:hypothetical protein
VSIVNLTVVNLGVRIVRCNTAPDELGAFRDGDAEVDESGKAQIDVGRIGPWEDEDTEILLGSIRRKFDGAESLLVDLDGLAICCAECTRVEKRQEVQANMFGVGLRCDGLCCTCVKDAVEQSLLFAGRNRHVHVSTSEVDLMRCVLGRRGRKRSLGTTEGRVPERNSGN